MHLQAIKSLYHNNGNYKAINQSISCIRNAPTHALLLICNNNKIRANKPKENIELCLLPYIKTSKYFQVSVTQIKQNIIKIK